MKTNHIMLLGILGIFCAGVVRAGPVTWEFSGVVTDVRDDNGLLDGIVEVGSPLHGTLTFESETLDVAPEAGDGRYPNAVTRVQASLGVGTVTGPLPSSVVPDQIEIGNDPVDFYQIGVSVHYIVPQDLWLGIVTYDATATLLPNDSLLQEPPDPTVYPTWFVLSDLSETLGLRVTGDLRDFHAVPEPDAALLVCAGVAACAMLKRMRRKLGTAVLLLAVVLVGLSPFSVRAADCNGNGIEDSTEQCKVDLIALLDASQSMDNVRAPICEQLSRAVTLIQSHGVQVNVEFLCITGTCPSTVCPCCTQVTPNSVTARYGTSTSDYPDVEQLGTCGTSGDGADGDLEDWAPATAIVAALKSATGATHPWTTGAARVIIPISDEGPRCGNPVQDPGIDRDAINHAITVISATHTVVAPIVVHTTTLDTIKMPPLAAALAAGGPPGGTSLSSDDAKLATSIANVVHRAVACDCDQRHGIDACEILTGYIGDCNRNFIPDTCETDCNGNGFPDDCDIASGLSHDANGNGVPDECEESPDCDGNDIPDACDLTCMGMCSQYSCGHSLDCDHNGVPDPCDLTGCYLSDPDHPSSPACDDCNGNAIPDGCDIASGQSCDSNQNGVPDECGSCCLQPFSCRTTTQSVCLALSGSWSPKVSCADCICYPSPASCCRAADCGSASYDCQCKSDGGVPFLTLDCTTQPCAHGVCCSGTSCQSDRIPSNCGQRYIGGATTCTPHSCPVVPDCFTDSDCSPSSPRCCCGTCHQCCEDSECDDSNCSTADVCLGGMCQHTFAAVIPDSVPKNRHISFGVPTCGAEGIEVVLTSLMIPNPANLPQFTAPDFHEFVGQIRWVSAPQHRCELGDYPDCQLDSEPYWVSELQCAPVYPDFSVLGEETLHVTGAEVIPSSTYAIVVLSPQCEGNEWACGTVSAATTTRTARWGDVVAPFQLPSPNPLTQPNIADVTALQDKFRTPTGAPPVGSGDIVPHNPNYVVNIADVSASIDGFKNLAYPFPGPCICPSEATSPTLDECNRCTP